MDLVEKLARDDKWQLGAGDGTVFAPVFPRWLDAAGFWDNATVAGVAFAPVFTVTVLDREGREIPVRVTGRRWTPAELTIQYRLGQGITASEVRTVHPGGVFVSEWRFAAYRPERIHLVAWTAQRAERLSKKAPQWNGALSFALSGPSDVRAELAVLGGADSWATARSEDIVSDPSWRLTPFAEEWRGHMLSKRIVGDRDVDGGGSFFAAVHSALDVEYGGASATFAMRVVPQGGKLRAAPAPAGTFSAASRQRWTEYFDAQPSFRCSDPYIEVMWAYGLYTARLAAVSPPTAPSVDDAERLIATRDAAGSGLFDIDPEDPSAAVRGANIKAVDATVRAYELFRALERAGNDAARWAALADKTRDAVRAKMWDKKHGMFFDVSNETSKLTRVRCAQCFLPYGTDIAEASHIAGLEKHLVNPAEFFTAFPVPTLAADDANFSAEGEFKSRRGTRPWNGRMYPALAAQVANALAFAARTHAPQLRAQAATLVTRLVRAMFHGGELHRVNSFEHYNPHTGHAAVHLGVDDIHRPEIRDLIIRQVLGVTVGAGPITVDPLPFGLEYVEVKGLPILGAPLDVLIEGNSVAITREGTRKESVLGSATVL